MKPARLQTTRQLVKRNPETRQVVCVCAFLVLAVLAVFGQTAGFEFVNFDDPVYVSENPSVTSGLSARAVASALTHAQCSLYHPLTMISLMVDYQFHGLWAGGFHLTNVVIHAAASVLLFLILRQMTAALWRSAFVAAVFALHPLRVESVAWVAERKDVLAAFFFMLTLGAYLRYVRNPHSLGGYLMVAVFFGLDLLCKPTVVTLPFVLLLLDYWPLHRFVTRRAPHATGAPMEEQEVFGIPKRLILEKIPLLALAAGACVATLFAARKAISSVDTVPVMIRISNAVVAYVVYLRQMVWPAGLAAFYPYPEKAFPLWETATAFLLLAGISGGVWALRRKQPWLLTGWYWYLGMLAPVIGIVQEGAFGHADRNTYLPQIGLYMLLTWVAAELCGGWRYRLLVLGGLSTAIVAALSLCAHAQTSYWRNSQVLWTHTIACTAPNSFARYNLGFALYQKGEMDQAVEQYREALEIKPDFVMARSNLGVACEQKGDTDEAIAQYRKALEIQPDNAEIRANLGNALSEKGQFNEAVEQYHKALEINPAYEDAHFNQGIALFRKGDTEGAIKQYREAVRIKPDDAMAEDNLGVALAKAGRFDEAIASYRQAIKISPRFADVYDNLGVALIQKGETKEAIESWRQALDLAAGQKNNELAAKLEEEIKHYEADRPLRDVPQ
ncbi:MAG: tetratricopeptide repeat protein [Verrucomicrobiota bacterium]|jgi:Flp pilus assembly protein TadD